MRFRLALPLMVLALASGCAHHPTFVSPDQQTAIERTHVEYPGGVDLVEVAHDLTGPIDMDIDADGTIIVAEAGRGGFHPRIVGHRTDGTTFNIYPTGRGIPLGPFERGFRIYGPVGGIAVADGKVYVSHCDRRGFGVITAFGYDGSHKTIVGDLPAQGDNGMTDVAIDPTTGRLWFGIGSATNSGVVGLDNFQWVRKYPKNSDKPYVNYKLQGFRFDTKNPNAGLFGGSEIAVTAPFLPFNSSNKTWIQKARNGRPTGAVYSVDLAGGTPRVEAHGIHNPRGIGFNEFGSPFMTNGGMELRGTRPIKDDPDAFLKINFGWYGWPDFSTDLRPITDADFQPPPEMAVRHGYPDVSFLLDHSASNPPDGLILQYPAQVQGKFLPLSGASKFDFVPSEGPLAQYRGQVVVALAGDRAPFANSDMKLIGPVGYKVVRLDTSSKEVFELIRNTQGKPLSQIKNAAGVIERPVCVKFAKDGSLYIVDFGKLEVRASGREVVKAGTGKIFMLRPVEGSSPTTQP